MISDRCSIDLHRIERLYMLQSFLDWTDDWRAEHVSWEASQRLLHTSSVVLQRCYEACSTSFSIFFLNVIAIIEVQNAQLGFDRDIDRIKWLLWGFLFTLLLGFLLHSICMLSLIQIWRILFFLGVFLDLVLLSHLLLFLVIHTLIIFDVMEFNLLV